MKKNILMFDTNVILRYLINDNVEMAEQADEYLHDENNEVYVTPEVIAEVVYVMKRVYSFERKLIVKLVTDFMNCVESNDKDVILLALEIYSKINLDFVDCVLYAYHELQGVQILTFDKKLLKLLSQTNA